MSQTYRPIGDKAFDALMVQVHAEDRHHNWGRRLILQEQLKEMARQVKALCSLSSSLTAAPPDQDSDYDEEDYFGDLDAMETLEALAKRWHPQ